MSHAQVADQFITRRRLSAALCFGSMCATAAGARWLKPTKRLADLLGPIRLEQSIPHAFANWREDSRALYGIVSPQEAVLLSTLYSENLARAYLHIEGYRVMLSVSYGQDQSDSLQLHYPEICYPAQGFDVLSRGIEVLNTDYGAISLVRLVSRLGMRIEPVSYWTMLGEHQSGIGISKKRAELKYTLQSIVPDGVLFRVSSVDRNNDDALRWHNRFIVDLLGSVSPQTRLRLAGL